jgi:hypothetical protein
MVFFAIACYTVLWFHLHRVNKRRENGEEDHLMEGMTDEQIAELGDDSPRFKYTI